MIWQILKDYLDSPNQPTPTPYKTHQTKQPFKLQLPTRRKIPNTEIQILFKRCAKESLAESKNEEILSNEELDLIWNTIQEVSETKPETLNYKEFQQIAQLLPSKCRKYFKPSAFLRFKHDSEGRIDGQSFFNYILRRASLHQERVCISMYDTNGQCFLQESELERYIQELIPTFPQLNSLQQDFQPFYLCGATRKFFFHLCQKGNKLSIKELLLSPILSEFFELQQSEVERSLMMSNWFSLFSQLKIYEQYIALDTDRNGMLSTKELSYFQNGRYNPLFIARVFQTYQTFGGELDYKNYLDFCLALNDLQSKHGLGYVFKCLDIGENGYLDRFSVLYFLKGVPKECLNSSQLQSFMDELFDMVNAKEYGKVTLQDLIQCGVGQQFVSLLIDIQAIITSQFKD